MAQRVRRYSQQSSAKHHADGEKTRWTIEGMFGGKVSNVQACMQQLIKEGYVTEILIDKEVVAEMESEEAPLREALKEYAAIDKAEKDKRETEKELSGGG